MNGPFLPSAPPPGSGLRRLMRWSADPDLAALRLLAALAFSCLLHGALFFLPFLGASAIETRFAVKGKQNPPQVINVTLALAVEHNSSDTNVVAEPESITELPPPDSPAVGEQSPARAETESVTNLPAPDSPAVEEQPPLQHRAEGADLLPLPAPAYYTTDQLTKRPQPLAAAELDAPEIRPIIASGKLVLKLWINEFGVVTDVEVEKTELAEAFSRTAVAAFKNVPFVPGERNGQPVRTLMRIEVNYDDGRLPPP